jgi:hypothetical protein
VQRNILKVWLESAQNSRSYKLFWLKNSALVAQ